jgi:hypothetical protein
MAKKPPAFSTINNLWSFFLLLARCSFYHLPNGKVVPVVEVMEGQLVPILHACNVLKCIHPLYNGTCTRKSCPANGTLHSMGYKGTRNILKASRGDKSRETEAVFDVEHDVCKGLCHGVSILVAPILRLPPSPRTAPSGQCPPPGGVKRWAMTSCYSTTGPPGSPRTLQCSASPAGPQNGFTRQGQAVAWATAGLALGNRKNGPLPTPWFRLAQDVLGAVEALKAPLHLYVPMGLSRD